MTPRQFSGKTSREVLQKVKQAFGPDALIVSNRPTPTGVEVTAMPALDLERYLHVPAAEPAPAPVPLRVRERAPVSTPMSTPVSTPMRAPEGAGDGMAQSLMREVAAMKSLLQRELSGMAWNGLKQHAPARAAMMQVLVNAGFSPMLARQLVTVLPEQAAMPDAHKAVGVEIAKLLRTALNEPLVADGGVYALIGPTGVGKTTTIAKLAARCVVRYGAASLGLITTDSYRIAAQDQLRVYGKILNVAVHGVKDAADMASTLARLRDKKVVLIDTIGMSQRDPMLAEQRAMLAAGGARLQRLLLLNATANAATLDEVVAAYSRGGLHGCILTKLDESASLAAALDCAIRQRLTVYYATIGQGVPEDIRLPHPDYLVHRALRPLVNHNVHDLRDDELSLAGVAEAAYG
jgi:flagellar biosynthesis protein FlhF